MMLVISGSLHMTNQSHYNLLMIMMIISPYQIKQRKLEKVKF